MTNCRRANGWSKRALVQAGLAVVVCCSFGFQCPVGGLTAHDFQQVSRSGFNADDNAIDINSYAWSMRYFKPDNSETGHVYVGTGNNIFNLIGFYIQTLIDGGDILDAPVRPPEIRRHRPDLGLKVWEKVFDYRDVETDPDFLTTGFRFLQTYFAEDSDPKAAKGSRSTYLYGATQGLESALWRSKTGNYGEWERVFSTGENGPSIRWFETHNGNLYLAMAFDTYESDPPPGEIWVSENGVDFAPLMQDGFGNPNNRGVEFLISYNDWLYAGTKNDVEGYEIWKLEGPDKGGAVKLVEHGGPDPINELAGTPAIFKGKLYVGSILFFGFNPQQLQGFKGCDIIRIDENDNWETVVGPNSISGYDSGFNHFTNAYCWWMEVHDGVLYAGTWDQGTILSWLLDNIPELIEYFQDAGIVKGTGGQEQSFEDLFYVLTKSGADIFKTEDGVHWYPVTMDGMGNPENYGWRTMESTPDGYLYLGSTNPVDGLEIWRAGGD